MKTKEFKINEYITLKLEDKKTNIYIKNELFNQCKHLALKLNIQDAEKYDVIQSLDFIEQQYRFQEFYEYDITPETEFWGHCSILQAWVENKYDIRLLYRPSAFPLLRDVAITGDDIAKRVFKEEIIHRIEDGNVNVAIDLAKGNYFKIFSREEIETISRSIKSPIVKLEFWGAHYKAPDAFYRNLDKIKDNIELAKWGVENNALQYFYDNFDILTINIELVKLGVQHNASSAFYSNLNNLQENVALAKLGVQNKAPNYFYRHFDKLQENVEFAKWSVTNEASDVFYKYFEHLLINIEIAKWGVQNKVSKYYYKNFWRLDDDPSFIKSLRVSKEMKKKFLERFS